MHEVGLMLKHVTALETQLEQLRSRRHNILQRCKVEEIKLPRLEKSEESTMETESEPPVASITESSETLKTIYEQEDAYVEGTDFSGLKKKLQV